MLNRDPVNALESIFCVECMRVDGLCSFARRRLLSSKRKEYYASWYFFLLLCGRRLSVFLFFLYFFLRRRKKAKQKRKGKLWEEEFYYYFLSTPSPRIDLTDLSLSLSFGTKRGGKKKKKNAMTREDDLYRALGIERTASQEEIRKAYKTTGTL